MWLSNILLQLQGVDCWVKVYSWNKHYSAYKATEHNQGHMMSLWKGKMMLPCALDNHDPLLSVPCKLWQGWTLALYQGSSTKKWGGSREDLITCPVTQRARFSAWFWWSNYCPSSLTRNIAQHFKTADHRCCWSSGCCSDLRISCFIVQATCRLR